MKLAISNIAWAKPEDEMVYSLMKQHNYTGLEIAPTRLVEGTPYDSINLARSISLQLQGNHGIVIPSMQSILFGRNELLFGTAIEREAILEYLKKAVDFAVAVGAKNLVFGSPKNRFLYPNSDQNVAIPFFKEIGNYAYGKGTVISIEANPSIYGTNYINRTEEAVRLARVVDSPGFRVNYDFGTVLENEEKVQDLMDIIDLVQHVHISEPHLVPISERTRHKKLAEILQTKEYDGYVSIEMKRDSSDPLGNVERVMTYVARIFGGK